MGEAEDIYKDTNAPLENRSRLVVMLQSMIDAFLQNFMKQQEVYQNIDTFHPYLQFYGKRINNLKIIFKCFNGTAMT